MCNRFWNRNARIIACNFLNEVWGHRDCKWWCCCMVIELWGCRIAHTNVDTPPKAFSQFPDTRLRCKIDAIERERTALGILIDVRQIMIHGDGEKWHQLWVLRGDCKLRKRPYVSSHFEYVKAANQRTNKGEPKEFHAGYYPKKSGTRHVYPATKIKRILS